MAKLKIADFRTDALLQAAGKAKVVTTTGNMDSKLENSSDMKVKIHVMSGEMIEKDENIYEVAKIKVTAVDGKRSTISSALSNGRTRHKPRHISREDG